MVQKTHHFPPLERLFVDWIEFDRRYKALGRPLVMAHRGSSALLPENSPAAFRRAVQDGADIIETDLHFTKDGHIVLIHDPTLDRTFEASGAISQHTLAELKQFRFKQPPERDHISEQILTLSELIDLTEGQMPLALELKDPKFAQPAYAQKLVDVLVRYEMIQHSAVLAFNQQWVQTVTALHPDLDGGWITYRNVIPIQPVPLLGPVWPLIFLNPFYLPWAKLLGKVVCPLDPTPEPRLGLYLRFGIRILITNDPGLTIREMERRLGR
jgi:glycerophosphoryl diester phosphodiesterase